VVGRAAPAVLGRRDDALHVKVVASREYRIRAAAARLGVGAAEAAAVLDDADRMRGRYHREYYKRDWNDPVLYHMVLNTEALGLDGAAGVVVARAREMGW
ncbi:MAG: AAA family ATPase, partial [Gemmatimonadales bacterium]